jgi:hypothetical protein
MNADTRGLKHKEITETEFFHVDEVSTGSGSDRVSIQAMVEFAGTITRYRSRY